VGYESDMTQTISSIRGAEKLDIFSKISKAAIKAGISVEIGLAGCQERHIVMTGKLAKSEHGYSNVTEVCWT